MKKCLRHLINLLLVLKRDLIAGFAGLSAKINPRFIGQRERKAVQKYGSNRVFRES